MKVQRLKMSNFMLFEDLDISWFRNINIISGENSTGKTTLIKLLYLMLKPVGKANLESMTIWDEEKFKDTNRIIQRPGEK